MASRPRCCRLQELRIRGFKSLRDVRLELRDTNILVGPNGSGKTAVLEALLLLRDILDYVRGRVVNPFQRWWGYRNIAWRHDETHPVEITLRLDCSRCDVREIIAYLDALNVGIDLDSAKAIADRLARHGVEYRITVSGVGGGFQILREQLSIPGVCEFVLEPMKPRIKLNRDVVDKTPIALQDITSSVAAWLTAEHVQREKVERREEHAEHVVAECMRNYGSAIQASISGFIQSLTRGIEVKTTLRGFLWLYAERERARSIPVYALEEARDLLPPEMSLSPLRATIPDALVECISRRLDTSTERVSERLINALGDHLYPLLERVAVLVYVAALIVGGFVDGIVVLRPLDYASLRSPQPLVAEDRLREDGSNLVAVLFRLGGGRLPEDVGVVLASVLNAEGVSGFFEPTPDGRVVLKLVVDGVELLPPSVPEGAWKTMALMAAVLSNATVIAVDEFENSLHPSAQELLLEELRRSGATVLVATHSPTVVDAAKSLDEIILLELVGGETRAARVKDADRLAKKLRELGITPSEAILYRIGV